MPTVDNKRIARNSLMLYLRMGVSMVVALYASRLLLGALGEEDFGIYGVVGGIVVMFGFINSGMLLASQRFMSYELGVQSQSGLRDVFQASVVIHAVIALLVLVLGETVGLWFLNTQMNIPEVRMWAANWVYQCALLMFVVTVLCVPYSACVIAHEKMSVYAYLSILDAVLKLCAAVAIVWLGQDKLILYSVLMLVATCIAPICYVVYGRRRYDACRGRVQYKKEVCERIMGFAGWSLFGSLGFTLKAQGVNIVINIFCGATVNAARAVAFQVNAVVLQFINSFQTAVVPQVVKQYAAGEVETMLGLTYKMSRFAFYLFFIMALPLLLTTPYLLDLWLGEGRVPEYAVPFVRLTLVALLVDCMAVPLGKAIDATGKIKVFQIALVCIMMIDIPLSYTLLRLGYSPNYAIVVAIFTDV